MNKSNQGTDEPTCLRQTIVESGIPLLRLSNETGVARASLIRFLRNETSLRLDVADTLADYFA